MQRKRNTPLHDEALSPGHCSPELRARILGNARYFQGLAEAEMDAVNTRFRSVHFAAGTTICHEGDPSERLFFVAHGKVKLQQHGPSGEDVVLDLLGQGALFGGLEPLGQRDYPATAVAQTECCVLMITAEAFGELLRQHPAVALEVLHSVGRDLGEARERIRQSTTASVETRVALALLKLAERLGESGEDGVLIQAPLPQQDLAAMVGATQESVSRVMSGFKRAGYIDAGRQWVRLRDRAALESLSAWT